MKDTNIKKWYTSTFPTDDLGCELNENVTFKFLLIALKNHIDVYDILGVCDSVIRERVFGRLSEIMQVDYNYVYDLWLNSAV